MCHHIPPPVKKLLLLTALASFAAPAAWASEFVGDLTMKSARRTLTGRIFVKDSLYRMDFMQTTGNTFVIVDQAAGHCFIVNPQASSYRVAPVTSPQVVQNDPFQAARIGDSLGVREYRGTDTLHNLSCDRYTIRLGKSPLMNEWVAQDLGFPIRIENLMSPDSAYVEITRIAIGPVDSAVFAVPAEYTLQEDKPAARKESPGGVEAGDTVNVRLDTTLAVEVALVGLDEGGSECTVELLRGGQVIPESEAGPLTARTFRFSSVGEQTRRIYDTSADQIRVRVAKGQVAVDIAQPR